MKFLLALALIALALSDINIPNPFATTGRYWWIGGNFQNATWTNTTSGVVTTVHTANIAQWDGLSWSDAMGTGCNGIVRAVQVDTCNNVYLAGDFTSCNGVSTGPIARWRPKTKVFEAVGLAEITFAAGARANAIAIDCANVPDSSLECPCDIFVGGLFTATIGAATAVNVAKYSFRNKIWDDLGTSGKIGGEVFALYKKGFGATKATNHLYVGGVEALSPQGGFTKYDTKLKVWGYEFPANAGNVAGTVRDFYYYTAVGFDKDQLFVAGTFKWTRGSVEIVNLAQFDWSTEVPRGVGTLLTPTEPVYNVGYGDSSVFSAGEGTTAEIGFARKTPFKDLAATASWTKISSGKDDKAELNVPIKGMWVCDNVECGAGSAAFVGNNFAKYYVKKTDSFVTFGQGTNGDNLCVTSAYLLNGGATASISLIIVVLTFVMSFAL